MKVGILTWHKAVNHGALLQSYASCEILKNIGATPVVLDYKWDVNAINDKKKMLKRRLKKISLTRLIWYLNVRKLFSQKRQLFRQFISNNLNLGKMYYEEQGLDAVMIGSDMVFDISEGYNPFMHGEGVFAPYIFSYAASFGYSTIESIKKSGHYEDIINNLSKIREIGYRDQKTMELCKQLELNVALEETVDPVLCYGFDKERVLWDTGKWEKQKYILIYAYDSTMNDSYTTSEILKFAKTNNLKTISCGYYHRWCDECIPVSPEEFLEIFEQAQFVITDTFHGTVFSLLLHKQFATIPQGNEFKVQYILKSANLLNRLLTDGSEIHTLLPNKIDYTSFDQWLSVERIKSKDFIRRNLERTKNQK